MLTPPTRMFCFILLSIGVCVAEDNGILSNAKESVPLTILDSQEVDLGDRSIIYNRIATPVLKAPVLEEMPVPSPNSPASQSSRKHASLFLWATVYAGQVSEVRFWKGGEEYVLWSSINFNDLRALSYFEEQEASYSLMLSVSDNPHLQREAWNALSAQPKDRSRYVAVDLPQTAAALEFLQAMEALHRYYDTHQEELAHASKQGEQSEVLSDKAPKTTVIHYFPIRSDYKE